MTIFSSRHIASQERFYFGDQVLPCFESGITLLMNRLQQLPDSENVRDLFNEEEINDSILFFFLMKIWYYLLLLF